MLLPLLWCLLVDDLRVRLNEGGVYTQGYNDDICLLAVQKFPNTVRTHAAGPSHRTDLTGLLVNPNNTDLATYTRKRGNFLVSLKLFSLELLCTILCQLRIFRWS
jgi:hypothetical protein